jgi:mRNA interferase MazF
LIVQSDGFNASALATTVVVGITSNLRLINAPGNVLLPRRASGLTKDSVINVSQVVAVDRRQLTDKVGVVPSDVMEQVDGGLRLLLSL